MSSDSTNAEYARLLATDPAVAKAEYILSDEIYTIGRSLSCQIVVLDPRKLISRIHATIERNGPRYILNDAGSANGTFVNGRRLTTSHILAQDDQIGLGADRSLLRFVDPDPTSFGDDSLVFDPIGLTFYIAGKPLDLTVAQHRLLRYLYQHSYSVCSRESCAAALWGRDYDPGMDSGALDQAFTALRKRLAEAQPEAQFIQTKRGLGYMLVLSGKTDGA